MRPTAIPPPAPAAHSDMGASPGGPTGEHWVLDPIDGTRGFVSMRQYAVCLGLLQEGEVVVGVLGCPNLPLGQVTDEDGAPGVPELGSSNYGCLFMARRGHGAYMTSLWRPADKLTQIHVQDLKDFQGIRCVE